MQYEVINLDTNQSHGKFETLDEARGCIDYDRLRHWQVWDGGVMVAEDNVLDEDTVAIPLSDARLIDRGYLPLNPNKCRNVDPDLLAAVRRFKDSLRKATTEPAPGSVAAMEQAAETIRGLNPTGSTVVSLAQAEVELVECQRQREELADALERFLCGVEEMTTDQYSRGEDKPLRDAARTALRKAGRLAEVSK